MRQTAFFFLLLFIQTGVSAQTTDYRKQQNYKEWVHLAPKFNDAFFRTEEAQRIGDNVLLYQQVTGGWPKNIYMPAELTEQEYTKAWNAKGDVNQSTIDNNATTTEIQYLARLYQATQKEKYKEFRHTSKKIGLKLYYTRSTNRCVFLLAFLFFPSSLYFFLFFFF